MTMKDPFTFEPGRVVESTQGRDRGNCFLVLETGENGIVTIADGRLRKLENPKRKKTKHLRAKPVLLDLKTLRPEGGRLQNSDLRRALEANGFAEKRSLQEESRAHRGCSGASRTAHEKEG